MAPTVVKTYFINISKIITGFITTKKKTKINV